MVAASKVTEPPTSGKRQTSAGAFWINWNEALSIQLPDSRADVQKLTALLDACSAKLRHVDAGLTDRLKIACDGLTANEVTVAFGGRFKSGKSLLVNRLINHDLLPVNVEAETGAPCFIKRGLQNRAVAVRASGQRQIACTTEALREELSLWRRRVGQARAEVAARIEIELGNAPIPPGVRWVDTPGLDESDAMDLASLEVFRHTDLLVWVLNSETPLAIAEADYIRTHVEQSGPRGIVFLTNVIIRDSSTYAENWGNFVASQIPVIADRLNEFAPKMLMDDFPPRMLSVCAAAIGRTSKPEYGAPEVTRFIRSITSPDHVLVRQSRLDRLAIILNEAETVVSKRYRDVVAVNTKLEAARAAQETARGIKRTRFERHVNALLDTFLSEFRAAATVVGSSVANMVTVSDIKRDTTYAQRLDAELDKAVMRGTNTLVAALEAVALDTEQRGKANFPVSLRAQLTLSRTEVVVPNVPISAGQSLATGLAVGVVVGIFTFGLGGVLAGTASAAANAKAQADKALAADAEGARASIRSAAKRVAEDLGSRKDKLYRFILASFDHGEDKLATPDRASERELEALRDALKALTRVVAVMAGMS